MNSGAHPNATISEGHEQSLEKLENAIGLVHFVVKEIEWIRMLSGRLCSPELEPERLRRDLESIRELTGSVTRRMHDFLSEARNPEEGAAEIVEIGSLVAQAVAQTIRREAGAMISTCIDPEARGLGVVGELLVALVAVLENAIDFSREGSEVLVQVRTKGVELVIIVEDSGTGMREEVLRRCHARGFTTRGGIGGHGFGLHAASRIMALHGGELTLESSAGVGTRAILVAPWRTM